jgi:hypothetical protein
MNKALSNNVIWLLVAGYFLWVLADSFFHPASTGVSATVNVFFVIAIATLHGLRRYHEILKRLKRKKCEAKRDAYHRARKLLEANKEQAIKVAEYLIEHGKIDGVAVERLFPV